MTKKAHIKTWGCQMNVYDSARISDVAASLGYEETVAAAEADLVILNTCHIREKASEKLFSELGRLRPLKKSRAARGKPMLIAVAGCVAQALGPEIQSRAPYVDIVFGPQTYHRLPEMIARALRREGRVMDVDFPPEPKFDHLPGPRSASGVSAFLAIQEGCDRFCSYCVVPYTRGAEYARPAKDILAEAEALAAHGAREITLLGQNVNAWREGQPSPEQSPGFGPAGKRGLADLLDKLAAIPGLLRLRYTTSHPLAMGDDLIAAHRDNPKLMPFLHLPAQSGSDRILAAMNRKHTAEDYLHIVEKLRAARPDLALSTDFIVGFPGETDADFKATLKLVQSVGFAQAYSFKYSRRPGTPAAELEGQIPAAVKSARLRELQLLLNEQQEQFNLSFAGKTLPVLFEGTGKYPGALFGRTPYWQAVSVRSGDNLMGKEIDVHIISAGKTGLKGEIRNP